VPRGDLTEEDLAVLLADMHVSGKIRWDAYEQAKHVSDLFHAYGKTYEWLSNHLRLSKGKIKELLDAYQEDLLTLAELRQRAPELKKKIAALEKERQGLALRAVEDQRWIELNQSMEGFLARLNQTVGKLGNEERQKIVRLLVKQVDVGKETITIHHSIPVETPNTTPPRKSPLYPARRAAK